MDLEYNDTFGFRIFDDIDDLQDIDDFECPPIPGSHHQERPIKAPRTRQRNRIGAIKEIYARVKKLSRDELKILRSIPRFQRKISAGKNWTLSEDLVVLIFPGKRKELAVKLQRSSESIRKRLALLREYGLRQKI